MPRSTRGHQNPSQPELFSRSTVEHPMASLSKALWALADEGIYLGTSSWKYESWKGSIYTATYPSKKAFEHDCLSEYAVTFPTVGADFSFYNWPSLELLSRMDTQTPAGFKIGFKATEFITIKRFPQIARWGDHAGRVNSDFLNPSLFAEKFLAPLETLRKKDKLAPIILEFTAFPMSAVGTWREFVQALAQFLKGLPSGFEYGIEMRTREFFEPHVWDPFWDELRQLGVAPILNSWTRTPALDEQWEHFRALDHRFIEIRPVMRPGRNRNEAEVLFQPYDRILEPNPVARSAIVSAISWARQSRRPCFVFMNNHLEGCAHQTIAEIVEMLSQKKHNAEQQITLLTKP